MLLIFGCGHADATSWRINNNANRHAHFTDFNAAMSSSDVKDGDTLYVDPGSVIAGTQNITKRVTVIGAGYPKTGHPHAEAMTTGQINIQAAGTKIESMRLSNNNNSINLYLSADDVTVERCLLNVFIRWNGSGKRFKMRQCISSHCINGYGVSNDNSADCTVENCIFKVTHYTAVITGLKNPTIRNNYICNSYVKQANTNNNSYCLESLSGAIITNNILFHPNTPNMLLNNVDGKFSRNILSCEENTYSNVSSEDNLQLGAADESQLFVMEGENDELYRLKEGSPAKGYAEEGGDCGPFDGKYPYVISGYPLGMPYFLSSSANTLAVDGKVSFSNEVKIQKQ